MHYAHTLVIAYVGTRYSKDWSMGPIITTCVLHHQLPRRSKENTYYNLADDLAHAYGKCYSKALLAVAT